MIQDNSSEYRKGIFAKQKWLAPTIIGLAGLAFGAFGLWGWKMERLLGTFDGISVFLMGFGVVLFSIALWVAVHGVSECALCGRTFLFKAMFCENCGQHLADVRAPSGVRNV
jgi:hypothetical protein